MQRIFDPSDDTTTLVATSTDNYTVVNTDYSRIREEREHDKRIAAMRAVGFGARTSYCG